MLAPAVAAVDDGHRRELGRLVRRAELEMPHRDDVRVVLQHADGVLDGLLVEVPGARHLGVREAQDGAAQAVHRRLGGHARARARLVERREERLVLAEVGVAPVVRERRQLLADLEDARVVVTLEIPERQDVTSDEASHRLSSALEMVVAGTIAGTWTPNPELRPAGLSSRALPG